MKLSLKYGLPLSFLVVVLDLTFTCFLSLEADENVNGDRRFVIVGIYNFYTCQLDFIALSFIRTALLIGASIGVLQNSKNGPERIKRSSTFVLCLFLICFVYGPIKVLALAENRQEFRLPWFWCIFAFNCCISFTCAVVWHFILSNINVTNIEVSAAKNETVSELILPIEINDNVPLIQDDATIENGVVSNEDAKENIIKDVKENGRDKDAEEDSEKIDVKKSTSLLVRLLRYCRREWILYSLGFFCLCIYSGARILVPYYTGRVISDIIVTHSAENLMKSVFLMFGLSIMSSIFAGLRGGILLYAMTKVNMTIRSQLFSSLVKQEIGFFDVTKTGDITSRLTSDCQTMSDTVGLNINVFLRCFIMFIGSLVVMVKISWQLTTLVFIAIPVIGIISKVYGNYYEKISEEGQTTLARANEVADEVVSSMRTVRSFANEVGESLRYDFKLDAVLNVGRRKSIAYTGYVWINELLDLLILIAVLWYGGHLVLTGRMKSEDLISYLFYQMQLGQTLSGMAEVYTGLMQAVGASKKVFEWIDRKPKILNEGTLIPESLEGRIEFRNVSFSYPSRPASSVLKNVSFTVKAGEVAALVGPSGGGKSSCISLLEHFYEPSSGDVLLDGVPVKALDHYYFHQMVSLVGQEPVLYARPIRENISYGLDPKDFTDDTIVECSKMANAHNFVVALPSSYETDVGEKGVQISGGQKQRIAIARALIRKPKVLLLDEATSALDAESEFLVQQALYQNFSGHTVLLIAHRLSTVEKADQIIVIDNGEVVQQGSHRELLQTDGLYKNLVHRQLLGQSLSGKPPPAQKVVDGIPTD